MATVDAGAAAARTIARARTQRQLRAVAGVTLSELHDAYDLIDSIPLFSSRTKKGTRTTLDAVRVQIETGYRKLADTDAAPPAVVGKTLQNSCQLAWVEIAGLRAEANAFKGWRGADILAAAIVDAPRVLAGAVGATVQGAGDAASSLLGSALKGLWPVLLILAIVVVAAGAARRKGYA